MAKPWNKKKIDTKERKEVPITVKKAFMLASFLNRLLKISRDGSLELDLLYSKTSQAISVFTKLEFKTAKELEKHSIAMWNLVGEYKETRVSIDEMSKFYEYLCMIIPPKDFKDFFSIKAHVTNVKFESRGKELQIIDLIMFVDNEVNGFLGTTSYGISLKDKPVSKMKVKKVRDKAKPVVNVMKKNANKATRKMLNRKLQKENNKNALKNIISKAVSTEKIIIIPLDVNQIRMSDNFKDSLKNLINNNDELTIQNSIIVSLDLDINFGTGVKVDDINSFLDDYEVDELNLLDAIKSNM